MIYGEETLVRLLEIFIDNNNEKIIINVNNKSVEINNSNYGIDKEYLMLK
jgi:hypothetical protein